MVFLFATSIVGPANKKLICFLNVLKTFVFGLQNVSMTHLLYMVEGHTYNTRMDNSPLTFPPCQFSPWTLPPPPHTIRSICWLGGLREGRDVQGGTCPAGICAGGGCWLADVQGGNVLKPGQIDEIITTSTLQLGILEH